MEQRSTDQPPRVGSVLIERRMRPGRHPSAMVTKPSLWARLVARLFFGSILFPRRSMDNVRDAAERATVVYVMQNRSVIDYLFFNLAFLKYGLPLARFANGIRTLLIRPILVLIWTLFQRPYPPKPEVFERTVRAGESACLFLQRPLGDGAKTRQFSFEYTKRLVDIATRSPTRHVVLVPLLLVWDKRSDSYHKSLFDEVFGGHQSPGGIRKFFHLIKNMWESLIRAGRPVARVANTIDLTRFAQDNQLLTFTEKAEVLHDQLLQGFERERRVVVGPPKKRAALIRAEILASEPVTEIIAEIAREKVTYQVSAIEKRAEKIIRQIAANYTPRAIKFLSALMTPIFDALYAGFDIDAEGLERLRETARTHRLVIIPSHKSHLDYLLISHVFYQHGLVPPHIAAGANLSFFPLGWIFRKSGAFFMRRSFRGDPLYATIFQAYLVKLLEEGSPVEFFIEGTRSRTGKLNRPRFGMLNMIVRAGLAGLDRVAFVPISVGYEKIVEGKSYRSELVGGEKRGESLSGVFKARKLLQNKHGRVYFEFAEPILLDDFLQAHELSTEADRATFDRFVGRLGYAITRAIDDVTTVTPSAMVAALLLDHPTGDLDIGDLLAPFGFLLCYLMRRGVRLSNSIESALLAPHVEEALKAQNGGGPALDNYKSHAVIGLALENVVAETLQLFATSDAIKVRRTAGRAIYRVDDKHRSDLSYSRTNILHFFLPDAFVAAALLSMPGTLVDNSELHERCVELIRWLKLEFTVAPRAWSDDYFDAGLRVFLENGWLRATAYEGMYEKAEPMPPVAFFLKRLLTPWLEAYDITIEALDGLEDEPMTSKEVLKACLKAGKRRYENGTLHTIESVNKPTFQNALALFKQRGIVESSGEGRDAKLVLAPEYFKRSARDALRRSITRYIGSPKWLRRYETGDFSQAGLSA